MTNSNKAMEQTVTYSKKQLTPFITKNNIDVENDELFKSIIRLFADQPNFHLWALKVVYGNMIKFDKLVEIKNWADENHQLIQKLSKKNIVSYNTPHDIEMLSLEMNALNNWAIVKRNVDCFNTEQRKMWNYFFGEAPKNGIEANNNRRLMNFAHKFEAFEKLNKEKKHNFLTKCSAFRDVSELVNAFEESLMASWDWYRDALLTYVKNIAPDTNIVYDDHNIVILEITSFQSSKAICGGTKTSWCITRDSGHFNNYIGDHKKDRKQYFMFNFELKETEDLAMVGFTINKDSGIMYAHTVQNNDFRNESSYNWKNERIGMAKWLQMNKVPFSIVMPRKELKNYVWTKKSILSNAQNGDNERVVFNKDNLVVIRVASSNVLKKYLEHSYINLGNITINSKCPSYIVMNLDKVYNEDNAIYVLCCEADEYGTESVVKCLNFYNIQMEKSHVYKDLGIAERDIISNTELDPSILLHKYVDDNDENSAIKLLKEGKADVNYIFNNRHVIFTTLHRGMDRLFKMIVNTSSFNPNMKDNYGEIILTHLSFAYIFCDDELQSNYDNMINTVLESGRFDLNLTNNRGESFLTITSACECCNWFTKKLIADPNININIESIVETSPMSEAIINHNTEIITLLGERPDLEITKAVKEAASQSNLNLKSVVNPQKDFFEKNKENLVQIKENIETSNVEQTPLSEEEFEILKRVMSL